MVNKSLHKNVKYLATRCKPGMDTAVPEEQTFLLY